MIVLIITWNQVFCRIDVSRCNIYGDELTNMEISHAMGILEDQLYRIHYNYDEKVCM